MMSGIKVDTGAKDLAGAPGEGVTEGLDGLRERLVEYADLGARFTKWRAVIAIGPGIPTAYCLDVNAHALARFAALTQEAGLVPMVEPEVLMDGDHEHRPVLRRYGSGVGGGVPPAAKPGRCVGRHPAEAQHGSFRGVGRRPALVADEVAEKTVRCLKSTVPASVPGIVFLSGGQGDEEATTNLDAINRYAQREGAPWELSFSYGRGLQGAPLRTWAGNNGNRAEVQRVFHHRARVTAAARQGRYDVGMDAG